MSTAHDPYRPTPAEPALPPQGVLPVRRLRRLGVSDRIIEWLAHSWDAMDWPTRVEAAEGLAGTADSKLLESFTGGLVPPDGPPEQVLAWVAEHPSPPDGARYALAVEQAQPAPRPDLVAELQQYLP